MVFRRSWDGSETMTAKQKTSCERFSRVDAVRVSTAEKNRVCVDLVARVVTHGGEGYPNLYSLPVRNRHGPQFGAKPDLT